MISKFYLLKLKRLVLSIVLMSLLLVLFAQPIFAQTYVEDFDAGFTPGVTLNEHPDWFSDEATFIEEDIGVGGTDGLAPSDNIIVWTAHPFDWTDEEFEGITVQMDFQTDASGVFDDDRIGWFISDTDIGSSNILGLQLDPGGDGTSGNNIEGYWDGVSEADKRPSIVNLPELDAETWYRFQGEITKLTDNSASITVTLTELDEDGDPVVVVATGSIDNTSLLGDDEPNEKYFTGPIWPGYKNYDAIEGAADNAYAMITGAGIQQPDNVKCKLMQNSPDPFNSTTTISYDLAKSSFVNLSIYGITGRLIETLVNQTQDAGDYDIQWNASSHPSGVYLYILQVGTSQQVKKCLLVK